MQACTASTVESTGGTNASYECNETERELEVRKRCIVKKLLIVSVAFMAMLPFAAQARGRVGVFIRPSFGPYYGWYGGYYPIYPYGFYGGSPNSGQVKLDTDAKDAQVFINGSYAGTVKELKTLTMRSGDYDIELRAPGLPAYQQRVYVVAGKTVKLHPDFRGPAGS